MTSGADLVSHQYLEEVIGGHTVGLFIVTDVKEDVRWAEMSWQKSEILFSGWNQSVQRR